MIARKNYKTGLSILFVSILTISLTDINEIKGLGMIGVLFSFLYFLWYGYKADKSIKKVGGADAPLRPSFSGFFLPFGFCITSLLMYQKYDEKEALFLLVPAGLFLAKYVYDYRKFKNATSN